MSPTRFDQRKSTDLRPVTIQRGYLKYAEGSCLIELGNTRVVCAVSVEEKLPPFLQEKGASSGRAAGGWITGEYGMIPRSTLRRTPRETLRGGQGGRTHEIQRLIGRSLRAVVNLQKLGPRTLWVDCDVLQADGGTRTASVTGACVALVEALEGLRRQGVFRELPIRDLVAATSVGLLDGQALLDLTYDEDSRAQVDMNVVMTGKAELVEVQGTGEGTTFSQSQMDELMALGQSGIARLIEIQRAALKEIL